MIFGEEFAIKGGWESPASYPIRLPTEPASPADVPASSRVKADRYMEDDFCVDRKLAVTIATLSNINIPRGVLGLDLAKAWGWAYINPEGGYVASGKRALTGVDRGQKAHQLQMSIADLVTEFAPDWIAIEKPHSHHYGASRNLFGYAMVAHWIAHVHELGFTELGRSECYAACVANGKKSTKDGGVVWARQFKVVLDSDDEADAIMVAMTAHQRRGGAPCLTV